MVGVVKMKEKLKTLEEFKGKLFSKRKELAEEFEKWAKKNNVESCPLSVITWMQGNHTVYRDELSQEAIKWINERWLTEADWMDFFNLTEEDLK